MSMTPPLDYSAGAPGYPRRPAGVTAIAVIGIVFGTLGVLCLGCGSLGLVAQLSNPNFAQNNLVSHGQIVQQMVVSIIGMALSILLLAASIGALNLAGWARKGLITFAVLEIIFDIYRGIYAFTRGINQATRLLQNQTLPANPTTQQVQAAQFTKAYAMGFRTGWIAVTVGLLVVWIVYCIFILVIMRRQDVVDAFEGQPPGGSTPNYPPTYPPQPGY